MTEAAADIDDSIKRKSIRVSLNNPTNCGTKAVDVLSNSSAGKLSCESNEYSGAFATTMTSQRLSVQSVAPSTSVII